MRNARRGWVMPEEDARPVLRLIEERIRPSEIEVEHRDVLIRLRAMIEEDLAEPGRGEPENLSYSPGQSRPLADSDV